MTKKILITSVGNVLKKDDGLGFYAVEQLRKLKLPDNVEIFDLSTSGLSILHYVKGYDKVIFIDVIKRGGTPGSIYKLRPTASQYLNPQDLSVMSMHEFNLEKVIATGKALGELSTDIVIIGCEPEDTDSLKMELSERVKKALPKIIKLVLEELKNDTKPI